MPVAWLAGNLTTGRVTARLPAVDGTWSETLDDAGTLGCTLRLSDPAIAAMRPQVLTQPARTFLAAVWLNPTTGDEEAVLAAGPVWVHEYDDEQQTLRVGASGLWSYYDHRKVLPVLAAGTSPSSVVSSTSAVTLGTIASKLVALAHTHTAGALPVVLPADVPGVEGRDYPGYELAWVGEQLRALTAVDGGPEIAFSPQRSGSDPRNIEWVLRTGTDTDPLLTQSGADWVFDHSVAESRVTRVSVNIDGARLASRVWAPGSGSGESRLIGRADDPTLTDAGWPLLEAEDTGRDSTESLAVLGAYATAAAVRGRTAPESWSMTVKATVDPATGRQIPPAPGQLHAGDWAKVRIGAHPYLDEGTYRGRITQVTGVDDTGAMAIAFQREIT